MIYYWFYSTIKTQRASLITSNIIPSCELAGLSDPWKRTSITFQCRTKGAFSRERSKLIFAHIGLKTATWVTLQRAISTTKQSCQQNILKTTASTVLAIGKASFKQRLFSDLRVGMVLALEWLSLSTRQFYIHTAIFIQLYVRMFLQHSLWCIKNKKVNGNFEKK